MSPKDFIRRTEQKMAALPTGEAEASTPQDGLLRAAENGQFEALVREAQPAQPIVMVTPEEREAELRAAGKWPVEKPAPTPAPEPAPPAEPERELTPNEQYIAEHCHWRARGPNDYAHTQRPFNQCMTEYDVFTGEIIGDGYIHYDEEEDDEW